MQRKRAERNYKTQISMEMTARIERQKREMTGRKDIDSKRARNYD